MESLRKRSDISYFVITNPSKLIDLIENSKIFIVEGFFLLMNLLPYLKGKALVDIATIKKIVGAKPKYASLVLQRLVKSRVLKKVTRNRYTSLSNPYIIATNLYTPSYLSFWSASQYLGLTEQIVNTIHIVTTSPHQSIQFEQYTFKFIVLPKKYFFGFEKVQTEEGAIFIVDKEKLFIDALLRPREMGNFDEIENVIQKAEINKEKIANYLQRTKNASVIKKVGYLLETYKSIDLYPQFKIKDKNYVRLNPFTQKTKKNVAKWRIKL